MSAGPPVRSLWTGPGSNRCAVILWIIFAIGVSLIVLRSPERTVTTPYREAAQAFVNSRPMYAEGKMGWLYPVQSAMVFIPFAFEPRPLSEVLWRLVGIGAFGVAIWRLSRRCSPFDPPPGVQRHDLFFLISAASIPPALGAARNGQTNLLLAALFVLACVEVIDRRWWRFTLWLCLALAAKPTSIVMLLLFTALHPAAWWRMAVGLTVVAALPFLHPNWDYVLAQYSAGLRKVVEASDITDFSEFHPADLTSLLHLVGIPPGGKWLTALRAAAAGGVFVLAWRATRLFDRTTAAILALALGCGYLMVFNPRTEANTYAILGPPVAVLAVWSLVHDRRSARSIILVAACVVLGCAQLFVYRQREYWIRPAETILLLTWLSAAMVVPRWRSTIPAMPGPAVGNTV